MNTNIPADILAKFQAKYDWLKTNKGGVPTLEGPIEPGIYKTPDDGWQCNYDGAWGYGCAITLRPGDNEPHEVHGEICKLWYKEGGAFDETGKRGWLGYPVSDEEVYEGDGNPADRISHFENGDIIWSENTKEARTVKKSNKEMLSAKAQDQLQKIDSEIDELRRICSDLSGVGTGNSSGKEMDAVLSEIVRRRRAFDSKTFFMVTFGMLKAGKSTLVNTFVGKEVSPVGRAKETTLRSSIILAADEDNREGIYLVSPKNGAAENDPKSIFAWQTENGTKLMDFLNGLVTREEFLESFKEDFLPFSETNLENLLTTPVIPEFPNILPPIIRIDASRTDSAVGAANLLKDGVAIFDTPGLDGAKANKDSDPFWRSLTTCGDYYLLVQSSMSAINKDCVDLITDIFRETKNAPLLVVFNEIAANFWQLPDVEKERLRKDSETASRELAEQLRTKMGGTLPESISINAGEASDAVFGSCEEMRQEPQNMIAESRVQTLRDRIVKTLREERMSIKVRNATDRMIKALSESAERLESEKLRIKKEEEQKSGDEDKDWKERKEKAARLSNAFEGDGAGIRIAREFGNNLEAVLKGVNGIPNAINPWQEFRGFGKRKEENCEYRDCREVDKVLLKTLDDFIKGFKTNVEAQFVGSNLRIDLQSWKAAKDRVSAEWEEVRANGGGTGGFPDSLIQAIDVAGLTAFPDGFIPGKTDVPGVPWRPWRDRTYGDNSVWEYQCARKFDELKQALVAVFPAEAAKQVGDAFREAIIAKGKAFALQSEQALDEEIQVERAASDSRKNEENRRMERLDRAMKTMENMKRILSEG